MEITEEQINRAVEGSNADQKEISEKANIMSFNEQQQLDMLVRDLTSVSFPKSKSEVRRRIDELLEARTKTVLEEIRLCMAAFANRALKDRKDPYAEIWDLSEIIRTKFLTTKPNE